MGTVLPIGGSFGGVFEERHFFSGIVEEKACVMEDSIFFHVLGGAADFLFTEDIVGLESI